MKSLSLFVGVALVLSLGIPALHGRTIDYGLETLAGRKQGDGIWKRAVVDEHDHEHAAETESQAGCLVTDHALAHEFNELAEEVSLTDVDGELCHIEEEEEEEHGHEDEEHGHEDEMHADEHANETLASNFTCTSCTAIYDFVQTLLIRLNVTTPCCLGNDTVCTYEEEDTPTSVSRTDPAKAYGYGFLMVILICACSLLGVLLIPLLNKESRFHGLYKYIYALMIALGTSALFCDAILHLIPEAFGLHDHGVGEAHDHEEEEEDRSFIWKGIIVIAGLYIFYLFEVTLHSWSSHTHHHHHHHELTKLQDESESPSNSPKSGSPVPSDSKKLVTDRNSKTSFPEDSALCLEPTLPHGACRDKCSAESETGGAILHPGSTCECEEATGNAAANDKDKLAVKKGKVGWYGRCLEKVKPIAWIIILGDAIHNLADGLALGAAISQSLSLGVSTMIAIVFHELPHELGDFAILLSTGLTWYGALIFNFVSSLTAVIGFFMGVAIGTSTSEANGWILAAAAGVFLYIALVDLLPELIHVNEKGCARLGLIIMANIGFVISFVVLLLIAIYEEELNTLITV